MNLPPSAATVPAYGSALSHGRIAVTGASGFVGRRLIDRLVADGIPLLALSRRGMGRTDVDDMRVTDYADTAALALAFAGADAVIHLAARAHQLHETDEGPVTEKRYHEANVDSAVSVASAAHAAGVRRFVLVSSIGVNGNSTPAGPFRTGDVPRPAEPYARSKWLAEQAVARTLAASKTEYVIMRPPLVYGPGCRGNFETLLKLVLRAPLLPFGRVRAPRTLIGVDNLVAGLLVAARHPAAAAKTFLITDDRDTTIAEIVRTLAQGCGRSHKVILDLPPTWIGLLARAAGKSATWAKLSAPLQVDGSEFRRVTGWHAERDPVEGLLETARHFQAARIQARHPARQT